LAHIAPFSASRLYGQKGAIQMVQLGEHGQDEKQRFETAVFLVLSAGGGLGVAPAVDAWKDLIRLGADIVIPTVQSMSFFAELDYLAEGYQ
jgi:hypothetical protein